MTDQGLNSPGTTEAGLRSAEPVEDGAAGALRLVQAFLHQHPTAVPLLVLLLATAAFSLLVGPRFFAPYNLSLVLQQVTIVGTLAIAQTLVVLTGGIDLSVGAVMVLSAVIMGRLAIKYGIPVELSLLIGIATGL
ncbi:MAG: ABC transporter permease, partial [Devosia sp.]